MRVIELKQFGSTDHFHEREKAPPLPKKGEVRIQIRANAFNPIDYKLREGRYGGQLPLILGSDCSGVIDAVGEGIRRFSVGDEVYAFVFTQTSNGTYAQSLALPKAFVAKKPKNLTFEEAASIPLAALTAYRIICETRAVVKDDTVFISAGSGGVGSFAIQLARIMGAKTVCTTAGSQESAGYLQSTLHIDPKHILLYQGLSLEKQENLLLEMNSGSPYSSCFDLVGGEMKALCIALCQIQGHVGSILDEKKGFPIELWDRKESAAAQKSLTFHFGCITAEDCFGLPKTWEVYHKNLSHLTQLIEKGELKPPRITQLGTLSVDTVKEAHALLEEGHVKGKLVCSLSP